MANFPKSNIRLVINLEEMDEFMTAIILAMNINADYIQLRLQRDAELLKLYLDENAHPLFSTKKRVSSTTLLQSQKNQSNR